MNDSVERLLKEAIQIDEKDTEVRIHTTERTIFKPNKTKADKFNSKKSVSFS